MCSINGTHGNQIFMNTKNIRPNSKSLTKIRTTEHVRTSFLSILALMSRAKVKKASSTLILFLALVSTNLIPCSTASCQTRNSDNGPIAYLVWSAPHSTSTIITHVIYIQLTLYIAIILIFFCFCYQMLCFILKNLHCSIITWKRLKFDIFSMICVFLSPSCLGTRYCRDSITSAFLHYINTDCFAAFLGHLPPFIHITFIA